MGHKGLMELWDPDFLWALLAGPGAAGAEVDPHGWQGPGSTSQSPCKGPSGPGAGWGHDTHPPLAPSAHRLTHLLGPRTAASETLK